MTIFVDGWRSGFGRGRGRGFVVNGSILRRRCWQCKFGGVVGMATWMVLIVVDDCRDIAR